MLLLRSAPLPGEGGEADMQYVRCAAEMIADHVDHPIIVVNKSTVPVGTGDWVHYIITKQEKENQSRI